MKKFLFSTFLFSLFFLLGACAALTMEKSMYEIKTEYGVLRCNYERGVYLNCEKVEVNNE